MKKPGFNPYLPSYEYIPDGEPHVYGDRVYVYGSHDLFNGYEFCAGDYMCYSAPVDDLTDWRCEGVIYGRGDDPRNTTKEGCLYAPDVTKGPDGRYYLYYCLNNQTVVSVAVCDTPGGRYEFLGYVHDTKGGILGEREGDEFQFDPGVLTEGDVTYLYTGFCPSREPSRHGCMCTVLGPDMITIKEEPVFVLPSETFIDGTGFEGHAYFEAPTIRKVGDTYYLGYSSVWNHELCYATSKRPNGDFVYRGVMVSNVDCGIGTYKDPAEYMNYRDNNHGGFEYIGGQYYIFYHRHTNNYSFSRQACLEPMTMLPDGTIVQSEITSCGPNGGPLPGEGEYPAYIACHVYRENENPFPGGHPGVKRDPRCPYITQPGRDGDDLPPYIDNMIDGAFAGFKYFDCQNTILSQVKLRDTSHRGLTLEIATTPHGEAIGSISSKDPHAFCDGWGLYDAKIKLPDGMQAIYLRVKGGGRAHIGGFTLSREK